MSVLSKANLIHAQRLDIADLKSVESFVANDFRGLMKFLCGHSPYIVDGLKVTNIIGTNAYFSVSDLFLFLPDHDAGSFFREKSGAPDVMLDLPTNTNRVYVELKIERKTGTPVTKGIWDSLAVNEDNENGVEFQAQVDSENFMSMELVQNETGFTGGNIPVATFRVSAGQVVEVVDNRSMYFQSGTGGQHPDKTYKQPFSSNREDAPTSGTGFGDNEDSPFRDTDSFGALNPAAFRSVKDWIDGIAQVLAEIQGTPVWFASSGANQIVRDLSMKQIFLDSPSGHRIDASDNAWMTWSRDINNLKDNKLRSDGTEGIVFRHNYDRISWTLGGTYSSGRIFDSLNFESPEVPDGSNLFLRLQKDVALNGKNLKWAPLDGTGLIDSEFTVAGVAGDFSGIAIGDYIRKDSRLDTWYQVTGYVLGGVLEEPSEGTLVPDGAIELQVDTEVSFSEEQLKFTRTRYSSSDLVVDDLASRIAGDFRSTEFYFLGRRVGDNFITREQVMSPGQDSRLNRVDNPKRPQHFEALISDEMRFQVVSGVPRVRRFDGSAYAESSDVLVSLRKQIENDWNANSSGNNESAAIYTLSADTGNGLLFENDGDELWAYIREEVGTHVLVPGDLSFADSYQVRLKDNVPLATYENRFLRLLARRQDIAGVPSIVFVDGTIVSENGVLETSQKEFSGRVIHRNGRAANVRTITADYTATLNDEYICVEKPNQDNLVVTLPDSSNPECYVGTLIEVKDANLTCNVESFITIQSSGSDTIDGESSYVIESEGEGLKLVYQGNGNWCAV